MGLKLGWAPHFSSSAVTVFQIHLFLMSLMCPVPEIFFTKPIDLRFHSVAPTWKGSAPGGQRVPVGWTCTWGVLAAPSEHLLVSQGKARSLSCFYGRRWYSVTWVSLYGASELQSALSCWAAILRTFWYVCSCSPSQPRSKNKGLATVQQNWCQPSFSCFWSEKSRSLLHNTTCPFQKRQKEHGLSITTNKHRFL